MTADGFQRLLQRAGEVAGLEIKVHQHMLRHSCGFKLANEGRDTRSLQHYLGHRAIRHTVQYRGPFLCAIKFLSLRWRPALLPQTPSSASSEI
jgi:integrase